MTSASRTFRARFEGEPEVVARAPGRVNLIGEHTDTSHLPVFPMAIDRGVEVAAAPRSRPGIEAGSGLSAEPVEFDWGSAEREDRRAGQNQPDPAPYLRGVMRELAGMARGHGAQLSVTSDLPTTGGLSSSSALTLAMIGALDAVWALDLEPEQVVETAIRAERHVGVESGGMDQTAIVFARAGHALRIDFSPPARRFIPIHRGLRVIVASSGTVAAKGKGVRDDYNARVVGCRVAAALLLARIGIQPGESPRLCEVASRVSGDDVDALPECIRPGEAARQVGVSPEALVALTSSRFDSEARLPVRAYARHVLSEAGRVDAFEGALTNRDEGALGSLIDASHASLAGDFGCSTPALDRLCAAMRGAGALGARLTGAGFGGFALALCRPDAVAKVVAAAIAATGGPAFEVIPSEGSSVHSPSE